MKLKFSRITIACFYSGMLLLEPHNTSAAINKVNPGKYEDPEDKMPAKKVARLISSSSRNNDAVRIYPDALSRSMHVVAKDNGGLIDFFVFDLEGTLLHHYKMKSRDHKKISGLDRGKYVYRVFSGDEETASGNFEMR